MADGTVVREWDIVALDKEIEIAPGLFFPAWTYNGQVPGPTLRCNEGERLRINFVNNGIAPAHHALPWHPQRVHGWRARDRPGKDRARGAFRLRVQCQAVWLHLYHCHTAPLKRHIHKGLYGAFIVNPDPALHGVRRRARVIRTTPNRRSGRSS